ncbi:MAG: VOC family protein [Hyphomicrobiales bacterium]|nr:VOC family protein [Hyphomicrobiales bacterium]
MTKLRTGDPWMPAPQYGASLTGLGVNLLVRSIEQALPFQRHVLTAEVVYSDPDIAVLRYGEAEWMLHADHTYDGHPLHARLPGDGEARGGGTELRLHGRDPDEAVAAARRAGFEVLAEPADKPHGLREAHIYDADGYLWVPDVPLQAS